MPRALENPRFPKFGRAVSEIRDRDLFLENVVYSLDGCWLWTAGRIGQGYGRAGRCSPAHRVSYEFVYGPVPDGLEVHHVCAKRLCVNPLHLVAVTRSQHRQLDNARIIKCPQGHPYTPKNTRFRSYGARVCMQCDRDRHTTKAAA